MMVNFYKKITSNGSHKTDRFTMYENMVVGANSPYNVTR